MTQREKLLERIRSNPKDVRFEDLDKLLQWYGFECRSSGGSHYVYKKKGCRPITIPRHKPVKTVYVKMVLRLIEESSELVDEELQ